MRSLRRNRKIFRGTAELYAMSWRLGFLLRCAADRLKGFTVPLSKHKLLHGLESRDALRGLGFRAWGQQSDHQPWQT